MRHLIIRIFARRVGMTAVASWLAAAAHQGDLGAQASFGRVCIEGATTEEALAEGVQWIQLAARQGLAHAQYDLALLHLRGEGVLQSREEALHWMELAAAGGHPHAPSRLQALRAHD